ncbi:MAG: hypothetical protein ACE5JA_07500 [bacterium]
MQERRQRISVRSAFRLRVAKYMITLVTFSLLVLGVCTVLFLLWNPIGKGIILITDPFTKSTARIFNNAVRSLFLLFFVLNFIFLWLTFVIARRVIGPFVRIKRVLKQIAEGDIPEDMRFRKNDEIPFHELTEPFNQVLSQLRRRKEGLEATRKEVDTYLESHKGSDAAPVMSRIKQRLNTLE